MKIYIDKERLLNYHPLMIYFMLQPEDFKKYGKALDLLNKYSGFTRGIFKFRSVLRGSKYSQNLSNELTATINKFNVILRLVDDENGNYNYALGKMNFNQSPDLFELCLQNFIIDACKRNIKTLKQILQYKANDDEESRENANILSEMAIGFKDAINLKGFRHGIWRQIIEPESSLVLSSKCPSSVPVFVSDSNCQLPQEIDEIRKSLYDSLPNRKSKNDFKRMMQFFEISMDTPEIAQSDKYVQGTVDNLKSKELVVDQRSRIKQGARPNITISITRVPIKALKHDMKKAWGVVININGTSIPVYFGSTSATMVYIGTLLKQKMGTNLKREAFKKPLPPKNSPIKRHEEIIWLENVYNKLFSGNEEGFDDWYPKMKEDSCHFINVGKSKTISEIKKHLFDFPNAIYYCTIQRGGERNINSYFYLDLPTECIIVPKDLEELLTLKSEPLIRTHALPYS